MKKILLFTLIISIFTLLIPVHAQGSPIIPANTQEVPSECDNSKFAGASNERELCNYQLALKKDDFTLCFKEVNTNANMGVGLMTDEGIGYCVGQLAVLKNDITFCDNINSSNLPTFSATDISYAKEVCISAINEKNEDKAGCETFINGKAKEDCLRGIDQAQINNKGYVRFYMFENYSFGILLSFLLLVLAISAVLFYFKIISVNYITIFTFLLFPVLVYSRYAFKLTNFPTLAHGDANLHSVILLCYGIFCIFTIFLNLNKSFKEWVNNDISFKKHILLTYFYSILFSFVISCISGVSYAEPIIRGLFDVPFVGNSILLPIGIILIIYTIKAYGIKSSNTNAFTVNSITASVLFILAGIIPAFMVWYFWKNGIPYISFP